MNNLDNIIINIANDWHNNLTSFEEKDIVKYEFAKNKFRTKYLTRTGEFLKMSKSFETITFNKICSELSKKYEVTEELLDEYLEWCFDNYDFFLKKYKNFSLTSCVAFAKEWDKNFLNFKFVDKYTLESLKNVKVSEKIFSAFEVYGIPLSSTKLMLESSSDHKKLQKLVINKLSELTKNKDDLNRLKNMLRTTVENAPYSSEILFWNYEQSFEKLFMYFKSEPWCPK